MARVQATQNLDAGPLPQALAGLYRDYGGFPLVALIWLALFGLAALFIFRQERRLSRLSAALLAWVLLAPLLLYLANPVLGFFSPRYGWWILPGIALWTGWGLSLLPAAFDRILYPLLAILCFVPLPTSGQYQIWQNLSPLNENFAWLRDQMTWGDVLLNDPYNDCGSFMEWDYYRRVYFPAGLRFVDAPGDERRVWVLNAGDQPESVQKALAANYVPGRFVGPPSCTFRLYESPPDREGIRFANGMRFHGADLMEGENPALSTVARHEQEATRLRLWWSVDEPVALDYSVNSYLSWQGSIQDSIDGPPTPYYPPDAPAETSRWVPGQLYLEARSLNTTIYSGTYLVEMVVYFWQDRTPVAVPGADADGQLRIQQILVKAF